MQPIRLFTASILCLTVALCLSASIAFAAGEDDFDAHESFAKLHFNDTEMDFAFALILGATMNHGCEIGEAFYTASNIKEGNAASWQKEWINMAQRVKARGEKSLTEGHKVSAREQFQRASYYYRASLISMMPDDPRFKKTALQSRELLKKAGMLFNPPLEYIEIPFEGTILPGYYRKASNSNNPAKTLIMLGGGETFAEDLIFYIAPQAYARGYNFITVDLPGQGLLPLEGKVFRADANVPIKEVIDYVLNKPETDPEKLAAYGMSGGGGFVPITAVNDPRLKAIAMNSAVVDAYPLFASMPVASATEDIVKTWSSFKQNTVKSIAWRWGVEMNNIPGLVPANKGFAFDPAKVTCPALIIVGEGEYSNEEVKRQQKLCFKKLPNKQKKFVVTPTNEGASNHCITENRSVMSQVVFDFFDDVFK
ncbi:alpha/beta hydrolase [Maridesulfovibrio ferrireducens]|uniref:alpha/beta hydrolase n=1 Tax=Maridesulfovibrio ferrireducens TaxID=246191 RepID=UPI001A214F7C|nr:alpha/beta hydrolase [Maridesulfovibrio ferrireducens]MBI9112391.1 alpha/beta hydrolase [Maridesulfovibrio ferrireducens]